tara:strand:+ start:561 stop:737 length:177 start_codon:yes stop_codon:yes gene_type:complete
MSRKDAISKLKLCIKEQIDLTKQAEKASAFSLRPILEKKDKSLIGGLLAVVEALEAAQ